MVNVQWIKDLWYVENHGKAHHIYVKDHYGESFDVSQLIDELKHGNIDSMDNDDRHIHGKHCTASCRNRCKSCFHGLLTPKSVSYHVRFTGSDLAVWRLR